MSGGITADLSGPAGTPATIVKEISMGLLANFQVVSPRRRTACVTVLGAAALAIGLAVAPVTAAHAEGKAPPPGLYVPYQDYSTGRCLDSNYAGSAYTDPCFEDGNFQDWAYFTTGYSMTLNDVQTALCLDSNYAGAVYTDSCNGNNTYQNWSFGGEGPGYTIQDYQTGLCLDGNSSGSLYTDACNWNNYYQNWTQLY
jgi:hypothetical protein